MLWTIPARQLLLINPGFDPWLTIEIADTKDSGRLHQGGQRVDNAVVICSE